jgi:hypothetical protein
VLLVGLVLNATLGWSWADPIAGLIIAAVAVKEGREAWRGEGCCGAIGSHHGAGEVDGCGCTDGGCADGCCTPAGTTADTAAAGAPAAGDPEVFQIGGLRPSGRDEHS